MSLEMEAVVENLHPWRERASVLALSISPPDGGTAITRRYPLDVVPGRIPVRDSIETPDPELWWPNGMGEQSLYQVTATVLDDQGAIHDAKQFNIGLRTVEIDRKHLEEGSRFFVRVNGEEVFCRGANLGPHDIIFARITDEKNRKLVAEAKNANMNMFRVNGVSIFEAPSFYDACDREGILVFQDFPFACGTYPDEDAGFREVVRTEAESAVRLIRHHPSIAIWCGSNECILGLSDWYNNDRKKPLTLGGSKLYNQVLPDVCRLFDPRRPYWPSSPLGGEKPNSDLSGDSHWWWAYLSKDVSRRARHQVFDECRARFVTEWGFQAPCHLDSMREYLSPQEMTPGTEAWKLHTNQMERGNLERAIQMHYADPKKLPLPDYVTYAQMCQAYLHGPAIEALRFRKHDPIDDCAGALIWSYSEPWGETGWSILDYYLRRKPSYYWVRRSNAPVKIIVRQRGDELVTRWVNDTIKPVSGTVESGWWRLDGTKRETESQAITVPANDMKEITRAKIPSTEQRNPREWLYAAVLRNQDGSLRDQSVWLLEPHRKLALTTPQIKVTSCGDDCIELSSSVFAHAVHAEDHGRELTSDNWFDLLPGVNVRIRILTNAKADSIKWEAVMPRSADY
jgi:beta-mannosidase